MSAQAMFRAACGALGALAIATLPLGAQRENNVLIQPSAASYVIGEGSGARTVEQAALPLAFVFPFHRRFTVDLTTAGAYTRVVQDDSTVSEVYGGTDTQLRAHLQLLMDHLVVTLGVNAPSGQYYVDDEQREAASIIGNDFLGFPISAMGNGPSGTVGAALAWKVFNWNLGVGGSLRKSMEFTPYGSGASELRYLPADETRLRLTVERALWLGVASAGITVSRFGDDLFDSTTYSTGDRVISEAAWTLSVWKMQLALGVWHLSRDEGEIFGGTAPKEGIRNLSATASLPLLWGWRLQPLLESRRWRADGRPAGEMRNLGVTLRIPFGNGAWLEPRYGVSSGTLYSQSGPTEFPLSGWQGSLLIRRR
jgi:hypothetical protein